MIIYGHIWYDYIRSYVIIYNYIWSYMIIYRGSRSFCVLHTLSPQLLLVAIATTSSLSEPSWHRKERRRRAQARAVLSAPNPYAPQTVRRSATLLTAHHGSAGQYTAYMAPWRNGGDYRGDEYWYRAQYRRRQLRRAYTVCQVCENWVYDDRKKEFFSCGAPFHNSNAGNPPEST